MSNVYGFDFLRSEHVLDADGLPKESDAPLPPSLSTVPSGPIPMNVENKPDLEKQFIILAFLQNHRGSGSLPPNVIYQKTGIDLDLDSNEKVVQMLQKNPKVRVQLVPDPENPALMEATYAYQAKYASVRDRPSLLAQINRMTSGIPMRDLLDSYRTVQEDLQGLITAGDVIAVQNSEVRDKILFPRGEAFLVELDGLIGLPAEAAPGEQPSPVNHNNPERAMNGNKGKNGHHSSSANGSNGDKKQHTNSSVKEEDMEKEAPPDGATSNGKATQGGTIGAKAEPQQREEHYITELDMDPRTQIRRGEAIQVGGQWFRVSSAVKEGPLSEQPSRAQAPLSVVSLTDLSKRNEIDGYIRPLTAKQIPLDAPLSDAAIKNLQAAKQAREMLIKLCHGRTGGTAGQLFGSQAHASNPTTLSKSLASSSSSFMRNKRPKSDTTNKQHQHHQEPKDALADVAADPALALYSHPRRHGCTRDVRDMYLATRTLVPESDQEFQKLLFQHKLLEPGEQMRRQRLQKTGPNVDNDGKPKKRRYYERKNQRMTNTHLEGTEIGAVLARAAEKQKQGNSVGDGGM